MQSSAFLAYFSLQGVFLKGVLYMESYKGLIGVIPFVMLFLLLVMTRLKSYVSSFATLIVTSAIAILIWHAPVSIIGYGVVEGLVIATVPIIWIIFAAVLAFVLGTESGAIEIIKKTLMGITPNFVKYRR